MAMLAKRIRRATLVWLAPSRWRTLKSGGKARTYVSSGGHFKIDEVRSRDSTRYYLVSALVLERDTGFWSLVGQHRTLAAAQKRCAEI